MSSFVERTTASGASPTVNVSRAELRAMVERRFAESIDVPSRFFAAEAGAVSNACLAMARRFRRGGKLLVFGEGAEATDAQHVSVEFVHPVIVGKRALPALALTSDVGALTGAARGSSPAGAFTRAVELLGQPGDIAMGIARDGGSNAVWCALARARDLGLLTLALSGAAGPGERALEAEFVFGVPSSDPMVVQEVHETLYHVLWELVHVFFEQGVAE